MTLRATVLTFLAAAVSLWPSIGLAQTGELEIQQIDDADYPIVEVTVTVPEELADQRLSKEPFRVVEDGRTVQPYLGVSPEAEQPPVPRVAMVIDTSGSMENSIERARRAADRFVASLPAGSRVAVVTFDDEIDVLVESTADLATVRDKIADIDTGGETALYAGVREAARLLSADSGTSDNVVLLSDGGNTVGGTSQRQAVEELRRSGAQVWAVELPSDQQDHQALVDLAGDERRVLTADADQLDAIYTTLATDLSRQYALRYESNADGRTDIEVVLDVGTLRTQTSQTTTIDATAAESAQTVAEPRVSSEPVVLTVPLLGTVVAYRLAVVALAIASLTIWLAILLPRTVRPRERLIVAQSHGDRPDRRLAAFARWTTDVTDRRLRRGNLGAVLDRRLEGAGLDVRPGEFVVIIGSMMLVMFAIGVVLGSELIGLLFAAMVPLAAQVWIGIRRDRRHAAFAEQLTDVLQLISSSLRAGHGLTKGIDAVSRDAEEPAASEFRRIIVEHRLGRDLTEAMANCATRMDNADFSWVVQAIAIHHDVGGDLAKVLDNIVNTIRDRADVQRQVRTLSAEGRLSARVLIALPILVLVALQVMNPEYMRPMLTSPLGLMLLAIAGLLMLVGVLVIRRMARIQY